MGRYVLVTEFRGMALNGLLCADVLGPLDLSPLTDFRYKYHPALNPAVGAHIASKTPAGGEWVAAPPKNPTPALGLLPFGIILPMKNAVHVLVHAISLPH